MKEKICPRCKQSFTCNHGKIENCWCSKVKFDKPTYQFISQNYADCLCRTCSMEIISSSQKGKK